MATTASVWRSDSVRAACEHAQSGLVGTDAVRVGHGKHLGLEGGPGMSALHRERSAMMSTVLRQTTAAVSRWCSKMRWKVAIAWEPR